MMLGAFFVLLRIDLCKIVDCLELSVSFIELVCFDLSQLKLLLSTRSHSEIDISSNPSCEVEIQYSCSDWVLSDF